MSAKWKEDLEAIGQMMDTMREENAKLRKHAEAMANELERLEEFHPAMSAYRADFPAREGV